MAQVAIQASGVTKWFGEGEARTLAVRQVNLQAYFGEIMYIVGPSGSGKTTLLSMLSGILRPNKGSVTMRGKELWSLSNDELADFRLNTIGFVFQDYTSFLVSQPQRMLRFPSSSSANHGRKQSMKPRSIWTS